VCHQEQVTKDIRIFRMHKFRTTPTDDRAYDWTEPFYKLEPAKGGFRLDLSHIGKWWRAAVLCMVLTTCGARHTAGVY
jgi:hypothetical protein